MSGHPGLALFTHTGGSGSFYFIYRPANGGRQQKMRLGEVGTVTLADAIQKAKEARAGVGQGEDPKQAERGSMTFRELAERFLRDNPQLAASTRQTYTGTLKADVLPYIGTTLVHAVTPDDVVSICQRIKARGSIVHAQRTKTTMGGVFAWGLREEIREGQSRKGGPEPTDNQERAGPGPRG